MTPWQQLFYSALALNALFSSAVWCVVAPRPNSIAALVISAIVWPFMNGPLEGHLLVELDSTHGITVSDILSVLAISIAIVKFKQIRSQR